MSCAPRPRPQGLREALPSQNVGMKLARLVERLDATVTLAEVDAVEAEFLAMVKTMFLVYAKGGIDLSEDDPSPWIALFSNLVDKRRAALRCAADG
jgi:hypothetical protein